VGDLFIPDQDALNINTSRDERQETNLVGKEKKKKKKVQIDEDLRTTGTRINPERR